jgi:Predicted membrane protein (DUF2232)
MDQNIKFGRESLLASASFFILLAMSMDLHFSWLALWLLPFPIIVFQVIQQRWMSVGLACVIAVFLILTGLGIASLFCALGVYFMAWVMGESIRNSDSPFMPLITGTLVVVMMILVLLALVHWSGIDVFSLIAKQTDVLMKQQQGMFRIDAATASRLTTEMSQWIHLMIPSIICSMAFLIATVNLLLARALVTAKKFDLKPILLSWRLPNSVILAYVLSLTVVLFGWGNDSPTWWQMANNIVFLAGLFIGIQGLAHVWRRVQTVRARYFILFLMVVLASIKIVGSIYILIGLYDSMNSVRRAR